MTNKTKAILESLGDGPLEGYEVKFFRGESFLGQKKSYSKCLDNHFLLYEWSADGERSELFGIGDWNKVREADERLYKKVKSFCGNCKIEDRTRYANKK